MTFHSKPDNYLRKGETVFCKPEQKLDLASPSQGKISVLLAEMMIWTFHKPIIEIHAYLDRLRKSLSYMSDNF